MHLGPRRGIRYYDPKAVTDRFRAGVRRFSWVDRRFRIGELVSNPHRIGEYTCSDSSR